MDDKKQKINMMVPTTMENEDSDDILFKYMTINSSCLCCNLPYFAVKINEAYLSGFGYDQILKQFGDKVFDKTGEKITLAMLTRHFNDHFNFKGAAVAEYNRKKGMNNLPVEQQRDMRDIFKVLVDERINDLELIELSMKQQIKRLQELEQIKQDRVDEDRLEGLEDLIMKQESVVHNLQTQILSKLKIQSQALLKSKELDQTEKFLKFLDPKTASFLGVESMNPVISKQVENVYIRVVIEKVLEKIKAATDMALSLNQHQKMQYFKELERQWSGIQKEINEEYEVRIRNLKEVKNF